MRANRKNIPGYGVLISCVALMVVLTGWGAQAKDDIQQIQSAPGFSASEIDISRKVREYFDFIGPVDSRFDDRLVVGDRSFKFQRGHSFFGIRQGSIVGIRLNEVGEVIEIKRLQNCPKSSSSQ